MKEQIIKILKGYVVDNIGETSPKIDVDSIPAIADEIKALQLLQPDVISSLPSNCINDFDNPIYCVCKKTCKKCS
jgi:hypothetical protein